LSPAALSAVLSPAALSAVLSPADLSPPAATTASRSVGTS
jgi:hypothetical protein